MDIKLEPAKDWEELGLSNDFLFGKIMSKPELCKQMLETILDIEIERIEYPEAQKSIIEEKDARSVRLDIYVRDGKGTVYNVEIQTVGKKALPKKGRYYQSMLDIQELNKGEYYKNLKQSYVIFICTFDAFHEGRHRYTFENLCRENHDLALGDGTTKIFLNTEGIMDDISGDLKAFLDYIGGRKSDNDFVKKLDEEVKMAKQNREWRREYMTLVMRDRENIEKGIEQGIEQGIAKRDRMLIFKWSADGRTISEIAGLLDIPEEQVRRVQSEQQKSNKPDLPAYPSVG